MWFPHIQGRMRPVDLGQPSSSLGGVAPKTMPIQLGTAGPNAQPQITQDARGYGMAQALANPVTVESGGWGEAIAEALAAGLQGRVASRERQRELDEETRGRKLEEGQRMAISEALANFDPSNPGAMVGALAQGAPEQALDFATALIPRGGQAEQWSEPYQLDGAWVRRNLVTNETQQVVGRRPQPRAGPGGPYPDDGYDYEQ